MKEYDILKYLLLEIDAALDDPIPVRTEGGDQPADPPEVVVSWDATRLGNYNGHTTYVGPIMQNGTATGKEYHSYFLMDADVLVRHEDELTRDQIITQVHDHFVPIEADASIFNEDTSEWSIGIAGPRNNSFVEPDWYEIGLPISFTYLKQTEVTDSGSIPDTISDISVYVNNRDITVDAGDTLSIASGKTRYYRSITVDGDLTVDGELYVTGSITGAGSISGGGSVYIVDNAYDEIEEITSEIITN